MYLVSAEKAFKCATLGSSPSWEIEGAIVRVKTTGSVIKTKPAMSFLLE
jgi:hypothetical protein